MSADAVRNVTRVVPLQEINRNQKDHCQLSAACLELGCTDKRLEVALELLEDLVFSKVFHGVLASRPAKGQAQVLLLDQMLDRGM
jgi:hypothetical protein